MLSGVTIEDPAQTRMWILASVIGRDTVIRPFTVIDSNVIIGDDCTIGPFAHIKGPQTIASGTRIA
jgi:bifunctional UDP-N-acetylglucosamine pyrophosphorylase / glucosamine-1-phosphate N-acetyltransferase